MDKLVENLQKEANRKYGHFYGQEDEEEAAMDPYDAIIITTFFKFSPKTCDHCFTQLSRCIVDVTQEDT